MASIVVPKPATGINPQAINVSSQQQNINDPVWIAKNRTQIVLKLVTNATQGYTIPDGYTLFITNICASGSGVNINTFASVYVRDSSQILFRMDHRAAATPNVTSLSECYPFPLKVNSKEILYLSLSLFDQGSLIVKGWLEPNPSS